MAFPYSRRRWSNALIVEKQESRHIFGFVQIHFFFQACGEMASKVIKSARERALRYVENASRLQKQDLRDNPGARTQVCFLDLMKIIGVNCGFICGAVVTPEIQ